MSIKNLSKKQIITTAVGICALVALETGVFLAFRHKPSDVVTPGSDDNSRVQLQVSQAPVSTSVSPQITLSPAVSAMIDMQADQSKLQDTKPSDQMTQTLKQELGL